MTNVEKTKQLIEILMEDPEKDQKLINEWLLRLDEKIHFEKHYKEPEPEPKKNILGNIFGSFNH